MNFPIRKKSYLPPKPNTNVLMSKHQHLSMKEQEYGLSLVKSFVFL